MRAMSGSRPRRYRGRLLSAALLGSMLLLIASIDVAWSTPGVPSSDAQVLAELPVGARHESIPERELSRSRLDIALPLAQFYVSRSRASGDLRYLGYAESVLRPWIQNAPVPPAVLVLE